MCKSCIKVFHRVHVVAFLPIISMSIALKHWAPCLLLKLLKYKQAEPSVACRLKLKGGWDRLRGQLQLAAQGLRSQRGKELQL